MPRHKYKRLPVYADLVHDSYAVSKLINYLMKDGKKTVAQRIVYKVFDKLKEEGKEPLDVLEKAIFNVAPEQQVRPRRLGGASYLVPRDVPKEKKLFLALNWIIDCAAQRPNKEYKTFIDKLYTELLEASEGQGNAIVKRQQTEKLAEQNKAFAHLKW